MNIVITGANGQLGRTLQAALAQHALIPLNRTDLDISSLDLAEQLHTLQPAVVINAAAYTAVDKAESEPDRADQINHQAPKNLAEACKQINSRLIHVSTDFVFDGTANQPYPVDAPCDPTGEYGRSKLKGEQAIMHAYPEGSCIVRTAWLYSATNNNFVTTMLRLMKERQELGIVMDQVGTPTSTKTLATFIEALIEQNRRGLYHWSDAGVASWYDFAVAIYEEATAAGLLTNKVTIKPIYSKDYPTPARRPHYSVLDKTKSYTDTGVPAIHWRTPLRDVIQRIADREHTIG